MSRTVDQNEPGTLNAYAVNGDEVQADDRYGYKVICHVHSVKNVDGNPIFWSVYRGYTSWSDQHVAENGDVIPYEAAKLLFPTIDAVVPEYRT